MAGRRRQNAKIEEVADAHQQILPKCNRVDKSDPEISKPQKNQPKQEQNEKAENKMLIVETDKKDIAGPV